MDEVPIPSRDDANNAFKAFLATYDAPAFVRRARAVEAALEGLLDRGRRQREPWLMMVRLRLGTLLALAGDIAVLAPLLAGEDDLGKLATLRDELNPRLRMPVTVTTSRRRLRGALVELCESLELFNRRWLEFAPTMDLAHVNELRDGYNRYYILEKECALRSARLAREGFTRLEPLTTADVLRLLPPLPVPALRR